MIAVYATIWGSMACLLIAELGRSRPHRPWAIRASIIGVTLGIVHSVLALAIAYGWDHGKAVAVAADRAQAVYGVHWSGSVYANYLFLAWWAADTAAWWRSPQTFFNRSVTVEWVWRVLVFVMVVNGAIIFASERGRVTGLLLVAGLLWTWLSAPKNVGQLGAHGDSAR